MQLPTVTRRQALIAGAVVLLAGIAVPLVRGGGPGAVAVDTATVARAELQPSLFGIGVVEARRSMLIGPTVAGRVGQVLVEQGDLVEAGQLLAEMDPVDLAERLAASRQALRRAQSAVAGTRAQAQEAESRLATAAASAQRYASLRQRGYVSAEAERAKGHEARAADAALRASQANIDAAAADSARLAAETAALEKQLANLRLRAPLPGLVLTREAEPGSTLVAGQAVLRLAERDALWLRVRIDQGRSAGLAVGLPAGIALRSRPGEVLAGTVARIEQLSDAVTEERVAMVSFAQLPAGLTLNEMAEVTLQLPARAAALVVPPAALVRWQGQPGVFVVTDGRARFRPVMTGVRTDTAVEILDGLAAGERVVTRRAKPLADGDRLRLAVTAGGPA